MAMFGTLNREIGTPSQTTLTGTRARSVHPPLQNIGALTIRHNPIHEAVIVQTKLIPAVGSIPQTQVANGKPLGLPHWPNSGPNPGHVGDPSGRRRAATLLCVSVDFGFEILICPGFLKVQCMK